MKKEKFPIGFSAIGLKAGLAFKKGRKDLAVFYSHLPATGAGVFTKNLVKAAPVTLTQSRLMRTRGKVRAILVNSGSANAATGPQGMKNAKQCSLWGAKGLRVPQEEVWVSSTGVIGVQLRMAKYQSGLKSAIRKIKKGPVTNGKSAAQAIMTTDTVPKTASLVFDLHGVPVRIWGCAKGSGMIHPDLGGPTGKLHATMLGFVCTDAAVRPFVLQRALEKITDKTFNCVSIDGDTSTNDFVGVMANGASGAPEICSTREKSYQTFCRALHEICERLTTQIALDGEGASRLVQIFVEGARTEKAARQMAAVIASSPLVKTAAHGADPNWGRVLMAMGRSGVPFDPSRVRIWLGDMLVCEYGQEKKFSEAKAIRYLKVRPL